MEVGFLNKQNVLYIASWFDIQLTMTFGRQYKKTDVWVETDCLHYWVKLNYIHNPERWLCGEPQSVSDWRNWS